MTYFARVHDGIVQETANSDDHSGVPAWTPGMAFFGPVYEAAHSGTWVECASDVREGHTHDGGTSFAAPARPLDDVRNEVRGNALIAYRKVLDSGVPHNKHRYSVAETDRSDITLTLTLLLLDAWPKDFAWLDIEGETVAMTAAQFKAFVIAQATFVYEARTNYQKIIKTINTASTPEVVGAVNVEDGY